MTNILKTFAILFVLISCANDDDSPSDSNANVNQVVNTLTGATWRVTLYDEEGDNQTDHFTGYNFTFEGSNVLTASNGTNSYTGIWSVNENGSNDDSPSDVDVNIAFASPENFAELTEDWHILDRTDSRIRLRHISGGDGSVDLLTFEKN